MKTKEQAMQYYWENREKILRQQKEYQATRKEERYKIERERYRRKRNQILEKHKVYSKTEKGKEARKKTACKSAKRHKLRTRAGAIVRQHLLLGKIKKQPCRICGTTKNIHAHHDDYSQPLKIKWFCRRHHFIYHNKIKKNFSKETGVLCQK